MVSDACKTLTEMNKENVSKILEQVLKWLKILVAIVMFLLGLLNESGSAIQSATEGGDIQQEYDDSIASSILGFVVAAFSGWPCLYALGACLSMS